MADSLLDIATREVNLIRIHNLEHLADLAYDLVSSPGFPSMKASKETKEAMVRELGKLFDEPPQVMGEVK